MTSRARRISKQEWKRNEEIIHDLHYVRGLPLCKKGNGDSVQRIMHSEHNFTASRAQLEAHVKSLNQPKNLKKEEWRAVHMKLGELLDMKIEARVKLSGKVLSKEQLRRSQRHAFSRHERPHSSSSDGNAMPYPNSLVIETQGADGEWSTYADQSTVVGTDSSPPAGDLAILRLEPVPVSHPEDIAARQLSLEVFSQSGGPATNEHSILGSSLKHIDEQRDNFLNNYPSPRFGSPSSVGYDMRAFSDLDLLVDFGEVDHLYSGHLQVSGGLLNDLPEISTLEDFFPQPCWGQQSPFSQLQTAVLATPTRSSHSETHTLQYIGSDSGQETALDRQSQSSPASLVQSLLQGATQILTSNSMLDAVQRLPDPDDVLDSLLSLLPDDMQRNSFQETGETAIQNVLDPINNALLYSLMNGFAGIRNIPSGAILRMLKKQHHVGFRIIECLRLCLPTQAKCLGDNLFRAAVEACDEEAVIFILQATRDSPNAINPNEIACRLDGRGRLYTPVELAAKSRHLGIVKILLAANADVNKTYEKNPAGEHGALELAIRKWGKFEAVDMTLVRTILHCHAEVRVNLIEAVIRWGQADLINELMSRLLQASHRQFFKSSSMLVEIVGYLDNALATNIIKQVVEYCQSTDCMCCPAKHQQLMNKILCNAAKRANIKLVEFLLPHTTVKEGGLAAAVKSGSRELVDLFLLHGASVGELPCHIYELRNYTLAYDMDEYVTGILRTPLAEAIRLQDKGLVHEFENLGALSYMDQQSHFEAAISAAAEIGDCHYIKMLLQRVPKKCGENLATALVVAISRDRTEAALVLLENGADVNRGGFQEVTLALPEALRKQNRTVVDAILEADVDVDNITTMENAVLWGDSSVIKDLIIMGADLDTGRTNTALTAAVQSRRTDLVKLLLEGGASPSARAANGVTPLAAAIKNDDDEMIQLLISRGAHPADKKAFLLAIEKNRNIFNQLLQAFSSRYPDGKLAFGGTLLITAIKRGDAKLLNRMFTAKFDVNSFTVIKGYRLTALGFAIMHGKHSDESLSLVRDLINHSDLSNIVLRQHDYRTERVMSQKTALLVAVETRSEHLVKLLLEKGADVHRPARRGLKRTPLQQACEIGSFKMVKLLLEHKADVNEEPAVRGGATALQLAAISGSIKIAKLLMSHGARVHAAPAKVRGFTAFEGAAEHGCVEMIRVLWVAVAGTGFTHEQIGKAKTLALSNGHRGCADYIDSLPSPSTFPLLEL